MRENVDIQFSRFRDETQLEEIISLIANDLSEPYSIYVYRYFIQQWCTSLLKCFDLGPIFAFWYPKF
jgi:hypothetical protein